MTLSRIIFCTSFCVLPIACDIGDARCECEYTDGRYERALEVCASAFYQHNSRDDLLMAIKAAGEKRNFVAIDELLRQAASHFAIGDAGYEAARIAQGHNEMIAMARYAEIANKAFLQSNDKEGLIKANLAQNYVAWREADMIAAYKYASEALRLSKELGNQDLEKFAIRSVFNVYQQTGSISMAEGALDQLDVLLGEGSSSLHFSALIDRGLIDAERENFGLALHQFEKAAAISSQITRRERLRSLHLNLAWANLELSRYDAARENLKKARVLLDSDGGRRYALNFFEGRLALEEGEFAAAKISFDKVLSLPDLELVWKWQTEYYAGLTARKAGDQSSAEQNFQNATHTLARLRDVLPAESMKAHLFARRRKPSEALFLLHVERGDFLKALAVVEKLKSRTIQEAIVNEIQGADSPLTTANLLQEKIESVEAAQQNELRDWSSNIKALANRVSSKRIVVHFVAEGELWVGLVHSGVINWEKILDAGELANLLDEYEQAPGLQEVAKKMGEALLPPSFRGSAREHIFFVPDYGTSFVALAGLVVDGQYLIARNSISLLPNVSYAVRPQNTLFEPSDRDLVIGDPEENLPGAKREAIDVASRLDIQPLLGAEATAEKLGAALRWNVLHIAGHSGVGHQGPWLGLADGRLPGSEIVERRISAELVFLASCASGAPYDQDVWGSLGGTFLQSGSSQVVASLWSVRDENLGGLVEEFYMGLERGLTVEESLARAQRNAIGAGIPISDWSPLVVLGKNSDLSK